MAPKKSGAPWGPDNSRGGPSRPGNASGSSATPKFKMIPKDNVPVLKQEATSRQTRLICELDHSFCHALSGKKTLAPGEKHLTIATNYVAVNKIPSKLYVYSIKFGNTTRNLTTKEREEKEKKLREAKKQTPVADDLGDSVRNVSLNDTQSPTALDGLAERSTAVSQRSEKARIFKKLQDDSRFSGIRWASDFLQMWTLQPIPDTSLVIRDLEYTKLSGRRYTLDFVEFTYIDELELSSGAEASSKLVNHSHDIANHEVTEKGASMRITALNALISKFVSLRDNGIVPVGSNKFFLKASSSQIDNTLDIHRGYFTSIRPGSDSVLLNINLATSAFYQSIPVSDFMNAPTHSEFSAESLLTGLMVQISYERFQHDEEYDPNLWENRQRVIAGFGKRPALQEFELNGEVMTVENYFRKLGYTNIRHSGLSCISVNIAPPKAANSSNAQRKSAPLWILPELLRIAPYQPFKKLLAPRHTDKMIKEAVRLPAETQDRIITEGFDLLGIGKNDSPFEHLQLAVGNKLLALPARQLLIPSIAYANNTMNPMNASWNLANQKFFLPPQNGQTVNQYPLPNHVVTLDMRLRRFHEGLEDAGKGLSMSMNGLGIKFTEIPKSTSSPIHLHYDTELRKLTDGDPDRQRLPSSVKLEKVLKKHYPSKAHLLLVVLPKKELENYSLVKRVCDQRLGIHTVCLVEEKLQGKAVSKQQYDNLALKFSMKLRGQNHQVRRTGSKFSAFENISRDTIVFGADVSHAGGGMQSTPSVAAVVASDDANFAHFPGSMRLQASTQEYIGELRDMVRCRILRFVENRTFLPSRILFYRDGVGEDQFEACKGEIEQIKRGFADALQEAQEFMRSKGKQLTGKVQAKNLRLAFIVVGKRHHTRFFATKDTPALDNGNLKPGLVVDQVITRPADSEIRDFWLQSHAAIKGTARAGHYSIISNGGFEMGEIQRLTHAFCYNYLRATKGVSYAGPAYYADRLCERGTLYLRPILAEVQWHENQEEKNDRVHGRRNFAARVAREVSEHAKWCPVPRSGLPAERNPWHPNFDACMFWL